MNRTGVKAFLGAVGLHAALLLFGGLLIFHPAKKAANVEQVDLMDDTAAEADKSKEKEKAEAEQQKDQDSKDDAISEVKETMPDLAQLSSLESPVTGPALAPLSLSDLEGALNPGMAAVSDGFGGGGGALTSGGHIGASGAVAGGGADLDSILSATDLDQRPRAVFQAPPSYPADLRRRRVQGTVQLVFTVDREGKVVNPKVERSTDPAFERPALEAVRQWRFEAGTRNGEKVQFKMRVPITFNASG